jgi:hypothetical protein
LLEELSPKTIRLATFEKSLNAALEPEITAFPTMGSLCLLFFGTDD